MNFNPLFDNIVIEPIEEEKATKEGIILPDSATKPTKATVLAVGPGRVNDSGIRIAMSVKIGDVVVYRSSRFEEYTFEGKKILLGKEEGVWLVL
jgi:chaperonin GroES